MYQLYRDRPLLVLSMIFANILLSAWCLYLDPVINFDGVTYLSVAQLLLDGKTAAAMEYYSWPFYSIFIAAVAKLFALDVEMAAHVLNTLLATSLTLAFVCIVADLSNNNRRIILIAMVVILLFPSITKYRSFIIRDFGYLSCYLWSLFFIFRFCATANKKHLIGWLVFAALSSLFRFEGIVFVLIAPYFLFLFGNTNFPHRKKILTALSAVISIASIALLFWYVNDKYMDSVEAAQIAGRDIQGLSDLFLANIQQRLGEQPLSLMAILGLSFSSTGEVSYELLRRMAVFYAIFAVVAYMRAYVFREPLPRKIWFIYLVANLLMLIGFSIFNNFLVSRYTMASALTLLILAPFTIDRLISLLGDVNFKAKLATWFMLAVLILVSIEGLDVRTKKNYIKEAGQWVAENLPSDAHIYSNDKLVIYYAGRDSQTLMDRLYSLDLFNLFFETNEIKTFDYLVLIGEQDEIYSDTMRQTLAYKYGFPIKTFYADEGRYAFIYTTDYNYEYYEQFKQDSGQ
ncbi:MAG: hypothetical protein AAF431_05175 [Pseudomonadota bacterium]